MTARRFMVCVWMVIGWGVLSMGSLWGQAAAWQETNGHRFIRIQPTGPRAGFSLQTNSALGIQFTNLLSYERSMVNQNLLNGAGVAAGDFDQDGLCDLYFCNLQGPNALYRNLGGWKFENVTARAGVACTNQSSTGAVFADVNGDGRLDLLVTSCGGPNALFLNQGSGTFSNVTAPSGLTSRAGSTTMALADIDRDGDLDLYVANYGATSILRTGGALSIRTVNGQPVVTGRYANRVKIINGNMFELGEPDVLYKNDGTGKFSAVSWTEGAFLDEEGKPLGAAPWDMGLSAMFYDFNHDGAPDLYVCNDFQTPDRCWINDGTGIFRAIQRDALRLSSHFSMSVDFADLNRDGFSDFFVADMLSRKHLLTMTQMAVTNPAAAFLGDTGVRPQVRRNTLFVGREDGTFAEIAPFAGIEASEWTWSSVFLDVDLDGYEDLLIGNGHAFDTQDLDAMEAVRKLGKQTPAEARQNLKLYPLLQTPNLAFRNRGDLRFEDQGQQWGFHSTQVTHGIAQGDFDNDGDLDLALNCLNAPPLVYKNENPAPRIAVRLQGDPKNPHGIGARLKLTGAKMEQTQQVIAGGRYLSGDEAMRVFAAPSTINLYDLEVIWPDGSRDRLASLQPNTLWQVKKGSSVRGEKVEPPAMTPLFVDRTDRLKHQHHDSETDEYALQPLLPRLLGHGGPGVGWLDLNGDQLDDLVIGNGSGVRLQAFLSSRRGDFSGITNGPLLRSDAAGLSRSALNDGELWMLTAPSPVASNGLHRLRVEQGSLKMDPLPIAVAVEAGGPLAVVDINRDGKLDFFCGGQAIPGRYPEAGPSTLWRREGDSFRSVQQSLFQSLGLVNSAVFTDLDSDGWPDLVVAVEWGSLKIFLNRSGQFEDQTENWGVSRFTGLWNSVAAADFNHDGQMDLVAGNWGLNTHLQPGTNEPAILFHGDVDGNGVVDLLEAFTGPDGTVLPRRDLNTMRSAFPFFQARPMTHRQYGSSSLSQIFGDRLDRAKKLAITDLSTRVFLNRGNRFETVELPVEAQWAPVFGVSVSDFDGDGSEDVFLAQNFYRLRIELPRLDGGRGLLLRGQGDGRFEAITGSRSGIKIYGEQRGAASADFNGDGRVDLAVGQNNGATVLLENADAPPGVRVRFKGRGDNRAALGTRVQWSSPGSRPLVRTLAGGSGYWSQDSLTLVFPKKARASTLSIRWPGGLESEVKIQPSETDLEVAEPSL